jgi:hypothetical protein
MEGAVVFAPAPSARSLSLMAASVDVVRRVRDREGDCAGEERLRRDVPDKRRLVVATDPE